MTGSEFLSELKSLSIELNSELTYVLYAERFIYECQLLWRHKTNMIDVPIMDYCMKIEVDSCNCNVLFF